MKKIFCLVILVILCLPLKKAGATNYGYKWGLLKTDSVLCELLNIPTSDPFFTDTIRHDYLRIASKRVSAIINLAPFREIVTIPPDKNFGSIVTTNVVNITGVQRWADTDSAYSLIEIGFSDVGQKQISTSLPARYYWWYPKATTGAILHSYSVTTGIDTVKLTVFGYFATDDFSKIRQIAHDKILLYALYKCYFQMEEIDIADKFKEIAEVLLLDQKNIMENRPINITVKKRVLSK